ncbi:hypothetical protein GCM10007884_31150 [Methylobacterium brachythecii]|uniref:Uncharacterized protein n=1 Tax=Methylobacterium brachythecii TaxID=1176177 RepID=A0ABQ6D7G6_9HYPH|nr:hypothetical protein GCM10007884_31150 [Methylobacterium brachythecii]
MALPDDAESPMTVVFNPDAKAPGPHAKAPGKAAEALPPFSSVQVVWDHAGRVATVIIAQAASATTEHEATWRFRRNGPGTASRIEAPPKKRMKH